MNNMTTYLLWRGDLSFSDRPFCDVDNLILSQISYFDLAGIVPDPKSGESITLFDALDRYVAEGRKPMGVGSDMHEFVDALRNSRRFQTLTLSNFVDLGGNPGTDTDFSALHIQIDPKTVYVSFRGTGTALIGWREDFQMSYEIMPSQKLTESYIKDTYDPTVEHYYFGGHSKGGNLALYAAVTCSEEQQKKLLQVYSNDGPGFCSEIIPDEKVDPIRSRLTRIVPEFSMIGSLFETDANTVIVKSSETRIMQHDSMSWEISGDSFVTLPEHSKECIFYNDIINNWIETADMQQRASFTTNLFDSLEKNGARDVADFSDHGMDDFLAVLLSVTQSDLKTRGAIFQFADTLLNAIRHLDFQSFLRQKGVIQALILFILGIFIAVNPEISAAFVGTAGGVAASIYLGKRVIDTAFDGKGTIEIRKMKISLDLIGMCIIMFLVAQRTFLLQFTNLLVGVAFLFTAYRWLIRAFRYPKIWPKRIIGLGISLFFFILGMLPLIVTGVQIRDYMISAGTVVWIYGVGMLVEQVYNSEQQRKTGSE